MTEKDGTTSYHNWKPTLLKSKLKLFKIFKKLNGGEGGEENRLEAIRTQQ
jgi:hypothetical protein